MSAKFVTLFLHVMPIHTINNRLSKLHALLEVKVKCMINHFYASTFQDFWEWLCSVESLTVAAELGGPRGPVAHPLFAFLFSFFFLLVTTEVGHVGGLPIHVLNINVEKKLKSPKKNVSESAPPPPPPPHSSAFLFQTWPTHFQNQSFHRPWSLTFPIQLNM